MKISKRLELLSNEVKGYDTICDVGCDHGLFSIYSILENNIKHAYLLDINQEPLNSAIRNFSKYNLSNATFILSNGLNEFHEYADCLIISGVGGFLISTILNQDYQKVRTFKKIILQPNSDFESLREYLLKNKFSITYENVIVDNKKYCYYLVVENQECFYSYEDIIFGPYLRKNISDIYLNYWSKKYELLCKESDNIKDDITRNKIIKNISLIRENILTKR